MSSDSKKRGKKDTRVELKYCEHCGGLWVREGGGGVYCERCLPKVADLPVRKKKPAKAALPVARRKRAGGPILPVRPRTVVEDYDDGSSKDATGGVA